MAMVYQPDTLMLMFLVHVGQLVLPGEIALVALEGLPAHLHYEIRMNGTPRNLIDIYQKKKIDL